MARQYPPVLSLLLLVALTACAATEGKPNSKDLPVSALQSWEYFNQNAKALATETTLLRNHPGWPEMARIIAARPSITYLEGESAAHRKTLLAIREWSEKWGASGETVHMRYLELARRSAFVEERRLEAHRGWILHYLKLVRSADSLTELENLNLVDAMVRAQLLSYSLDSMGLLQTLENNQ